MENKTKFDCSDSDWSIDRINEIYGYIKEIADEFNLEYYPEQIELITAEQMCDAYSSIGMPINYNHWSFGKSFLQNYKQYQSGRMNLAYEIVINSNPCIAYLMEENTMAMQTLVLAHASIGHSSFFKCNYLFKENTEADAVIDMLAYSKNAIAEYEEKYGSTRVEELIDACHALANHGVDYAKQKRTISKTKQEELDRLHDEHVRLQRDALWDKVIPKTETQEVDDFSFPESPEYNILYFLEKYSPILQDWEREVVRIVRKQAQYFHPQRQTQVMNEGWATFWHYTIMHELFNRGIISEGYILEFLTSHTGVIGQRPLTAINPYALGFAMFNDIKRMCMEPTEEDREWFPAIVDTDWLTTIDFAMRNFRDESFITQYLSPKVIRDFKLFSLVDDAKNNYRSIGGIHNDHGYAHIIQTLSDQYNINRMPQIAVTEANLRSTRKLELTHFGVDGNLIDEKSVYQMLHHVNTLWGLSSQLSSFGSVDKKPKVYISTFEDRTK